MMTLSNDVAVSLITTVGGVVGGILGKSGFDNMRNRRSGDSTANTERERRRSRELNIEDVLRSRAELEFQTKMTLLLEKLTESLDTANTQAVLITQAVTQAATAIREVHDDIIKHREESSVGIRAAVASYELMQKIASRVAS